MRPVGQREDREFFTVHELLDEYFAAGVAQRTTLEHHRDGIVRVSNRLRHHHALSGGESGGLDDHRSTEAPGFCLGRGWVAERVRGGRRHAGSHHQSLRPCLRRLDARGVCRRSEHGQALLPKSVHDSCVKGRLGTHHGQLHAFAPREGRQRLDISRRQRLAAAQLRDPGVAGSGDHLG